MLEVGQVSFSWFPWYLTLVRWCLKNFWIPLARENARSRSYGASKVRVWWMKFGSISKLLNSSTIKLSVLPHHKGLQAILPSWKRGWWRRPSRQALALVLLWSDPSVRWEHSSTNLLISSTSWETACWKLQVSFLLNGTIFVFYLKWPQGFFITDLSQANQATCSLPPAEDGCDPGTYCVDKVFLKTIFLSPKVFFWHNHLFLCCEGGQLPALLPNHLPRRPHVLPGLGVGD